jgi:hypothetical protein
MIMPGLTSITINPKPETFGRPKAVGAGVLPAKVFFLLGLKRYEAREAESLSVSPPASPTSGKVAPSHHCPLRRYESSKQAAKAAEGHLKLALPGGVEPQSFPARDAVILRIFVKQTSEVFETSEVYEGGVKAAEGGLNGIRNAVTLRIAEFEPARLPSPKSVRVFAFRTDFGEAGLHCRRSCILQGVLSVEGVAGNRGKA